MAPLLGRLGAKVRELREARGVSLRAFARGLKLSASFVSEVERGQRYPSLRTMRDMAAALEVPVETLETLDARPATRRLLRLFAEHPEYAAAFDLAVAEGVTPAEVESWLSWRRLI